MRISVGEPNPPNSNPFDYDFNSMGFTLGSNVMFLFPKKGGFISHFYVVNTITGERIIFDLTDTGEHTPIGEIIYSTFPAIVRDDVNELNAVAQPVAKTPINQSIIGSNNIQINTVGNSNKVTINKDSVNMDEGDTL
jgi:hypothetical protein